MGDLGGAFPCLTIQDRMNCVLILILFYFSFSFSLQVCLICGGVRDVSYRKRFLGKLIE